MTSFLDPALCCIEHLNYPLSPSISTIHPSKTSDWSLGRKISPPMQDNLATVTRRASFSMERGSDYGDYGNSEELYTAVTFSALISQNFPERQTAAWPGPTYGWHSSHPAGLSKEGTLLGQVERYGSTE